MGNPLVAGKDPRARARSHDSLRSLKVAAQRRWPAGFLALLSGALAHRKSSGENGRKMGHGTVVTALPRTTPPQT